jgi:hypothetical protein
MPPRLDVLTPTDLEYWGIRAHRPGVAVYKSDVALQKWIVPTDVDGIIVCGLAGSLIPTLKPGTVHIPDLVRSPDGTVSRCDPELRAALVDGARSIGFNPETGPLVTTRSFITGPERADWARSGFVAADMETGLAALLAPRIVALRVILDAPAKPISDRWLTPSRAVMRPALWPELLWLGWSAPRYALRAGRVLKAGLARIPGLKT